MDPLIKIFWPEAGGHTPSLPRCSGTEPLNTHSVGIHHENLTEHSHWANEETCASVGTYLMLIHPQHFGASSAHLFCTFTLSFSLILGQHSTGLDYQALHAPMELGIEPVECACSWPRPHLLVLCWDRQALIGWHWGWTLHVKLIRPKWPRHYWHM